jgi:hypothetical protein
LTFVSQYADQQFFLFDQNEMINALLMLSVWSQKNYETIFQKNSIIVPDSSTPFSFFSFVDILVVNGFPLELIKILFALMAVCPLIIFWRQWLWFYSFDFFYPLMLALAWFLLPLQSFVFMIGIGMFSTIVITLLTKIHLYLSSVKKIIFFLVVLILTMIVVAILIFLGIHYKLLNQLYNPLFLPLFVVINFVMLRLFYNNLHVREIKRRTRLIQLVVMTILIVLFLVWEWLQNFFLVYPWVSIFVIGVSFWLTRYLWLQLLEYIRFWSLLTKHRSTPSPQNKLKQ